LRLPDQPDRIVQTRRSQPRIAGCAIGLKDGSAIDLVLKPVFTRIAVRAYPHVEARTILARNYIPGPVMVDRRGERIDDFPTGRADVRIARLVGGTNDLVGIGDQ
jgi:hypothetical protein